MFRTNTVIVMIMRGDGRPLARSRRILKLGNKAMPLQFFVFRQTAKLKQCWINIQ